MKKKLGLVAIAAILLASLITPFTVFADDSDTSADVRPVKDGLAIVAPHAAAVGQEVQMTVFQCSDQTPVADAGVWAISPEKLAEIRGQFNLSEQNADAVTDQQYEELLAVNGAFLGKTDDSGKLWTTFDEASRYMLVTFKAGYRPDARLIAVGMTSVRTKLVIDAPDQAEVNETITITVTDRANQEAVEDAGVWAITREQAETLKAEITAAREAEADEDTLSAQIENSLDFSGIFLGTTNGAGKLDASFDTEGAYLLVTFKRGYLPGFKAIRVGELPTVLVIDAPLRAKVDEDITITVFERNTGDAVAEAGVWAVSRETVASFRTEMAAARELGDAESVQAEVENILNTYCVFLGATGDDGQLLTSFDTEGGYLLVTYKPGSWPGFKPILIVGDAPAVSVADTDAALRAEEQAPIDELKP